MLKRSRRKPLGRNKVSWRLALYLMVYGVLALGLASVVSYGYQTLKNHPAFAIQALAIQGVSPQTEQHLRQRLAWVLNRNIFSLDLAEIKRQVSSHPWVADARVHGQLPHTLKIVLSERRPTGLIRLDDDIFLVGPEGEVICPFESYANPLDFPVIIGLDKKKDVVAATRSGLAVLARIKEASLLFWDNLETLDLADENNMVAALKNENAPLYLGDRILVENVRNYLIIAEHLQKNYPNLAYIELGFPNQIAIMPAGAN